MSSDAQPYRPPARGIVQLEPPSACRPWLGATTRRALGWVATAIVAPTVAAFLAALLYGWIHP
jgi:hypothetical protein